MDWLWKSSETWNWHPIKMLVCLILYGPVQANDGLSWPISGSANIEKQQYVNLKRLFEVLP